MRLLIAFDHSAPIDKIQKFLSGRWNEADRSWITLRSSSSEAEVSEGICALLSGQAEIRRLETRAFP